ncbi:MAG: PAS domain S-box protein, partial [Candidatus Thermoplasmatota archaeon]|nr:PAS domain S-box protein [Candidatus Thermoplasmatota archaeon]
IPITFPNGSKQLLIVVRDITDLKRFEEKIQESERRYKTIFEESTDAIVVIKDDIIVSANPRFSEILGYSIEEINSISSKEKGHDGKGPSSDYVSILGQEEHQTEQILTIVDKAGKVHIIEKRTKKIIWDSKPALLTIFSEVTEQRILEEQYKSIFKYAPIAISLTDSANERIIFVNDTMAKNFNVTPDELKGKDWKDLLPPDIYKKRYEIGRKVLDTNTIQSFFDVRDKRYLKTDFVPIDMPDNTRFLLILSNDITDLKQKEEELRVSEGRYRALFEQANEAIAVAQDGVLKLVNPQFEKMVGHTTEYIQRTPFIEFIHPDDRELVFSRYQKRLKGDIPPQQYDFRVIDKQGCVRWVSIRAVLFEWEKRPATLNFITDITQQKRVEQELIDSEEKFRTITTSAQDSIIMIDNEGNIVFWNQASEKTFGYTQQEILGKPAHALLASSTIHKRIQKGLDRFKDTGYGPFMGKTIELVALKKTGESFPIELSLSSVQINDIWNAIAIVRDISERKRLERELKRSYGMLEKKVEQRTAELHESEKRYRALFDFAPVGIGKSDENGNVVDANKQMIEIMGYSNLHDLQNTNLKKLYVNPDDRNRLLLEIQEKGFVRDWLVQLKRKNGESYHALLNIDVLRDGKKRFLFTTVRDVTDLVMKQQEITEARDYLTTIIDSATEQIMAVDANLIITMWNRSAVDLTGYKAKEMIGRHIRDCPCFDAPRALIDYMKSVLEGYDAPLEDIIFSLKDTGKRIVRFSSSIIRSGKKEIKGVLFVGQDITNLSTIHGRLLKGTSYLIKDASPKVAIDVFSNLQVEGYKGLLLSRGDRASIQSIFSSLDTTMFFFDHDRLPNVNTIVSLDDVYDQVEEFIKYHDPSVVLIDRLDYLIVRYSFKNVLSLLYRINSLVSAHHAILLLHINPDLIPEKDLLFLSEEFRVLPSQKVDSLSISPQLYDLLMFVYEANQRNVSVPFQSIGDHFTISKVTTQKRVHNLERMGLVRVSVKGRMKTVFVTKDGELLLHGRPAV